MFTAGASISGADCGKAPLYQPRNGLFLKPWDESLSKVEQRQLLDFASRKEDEKYFDLTLIKQIESFSLKIQIMERWERDAFQNFENAQEKLKGCRELWINCNNEKDGPIWYVDIGDGNLTWTSYNFIESGARLSSVQTQQTSGIMHGLVGWKSY